MIDQATMDVSMGIEYLNHHYSPYATEVHQFLDDALHALHLSKNLSQNGYIATPFLTNVSEEIKRAK